MPEKRIVPEVGRGGRKTALLSLVLMLVVCGAGLVAFRGFAVEQWYLWRLRFGDEPGRESAADRLGKLRSRRAVPLLIDCLPKSRLPPREGDLHRHYSRRALLEIGEYALPDLLEALDSEIPHIQSGVGTVVYQISTRASAVPYAIRYISHPGGKVRRFCLNVLWRYRTPLALPGLIKRLQDADPQLRALAADIVVKTEQSERVERALVGMLGATDTLTRQAGIRALAYLGEEVGERRWPGDQTEEALVELLRAVDAKTRHEAITALGHLRGKSTVVPSALAELFVNARDETYLVSRFPCHPDDPILASGGMCYETGDVRCLIAETLASLGPTALEVAPVLESYRDDAEVGECVSLALRCIDAHGGPRSR